MLRRLVTLAFLGLSLTAFPQSVPPAADISVHPPVAGNNDTSLVSTPAPPSVTVTTAVSLDPSDRAFVQRYISAMGVLTAESQNSQQKSSVQTQRLQRRFSHQVTLLQNKESLHQTQVQNHQKLLQTEAYGFIDSLRKKYNAPEGSTFDAQAFTFNSTTRK